jgi:hypothetical protein
VEEESAKLLTFLTPAGRFEYQGLPFGISIALQIFHKAVIGALAAGIPGVEVFVDNIFIHAPTRHKHEERLALVWQRLKENAQQTSSSLDTLWGVEKLARAPTK